MPETLTESFCERCGTRYTFESAAPKGKRLGKIKVLSKGFVNFVSNDDRSLDEAFAEARSDEQREQTSQQLDAFHQTFQFCMSCRQYTCANCWNDVESRCLSCAPLFGGDTLGGAFPAALDPLARLGLGQPTPEIHAANGHQNGEAELPALAEPAADSAWPTADRARDGGTAEVPWPELAALPAVAGDSGEPSAEAGAPETVQPEGLASEAAAQAAASGDDALAEAAASETDVPGMAAWEAARSAFEDQPEAAAPDAISDDAVDEDVALAVAEAERVRLAAAEAEQVRQAAEAGAELDRLRQAADAEAQREREVAAAAEAEAEQQRQVVAAAAEAERDRLAAQVQADYLRAAEAVEAASEAETKAERQAAVEAEALRQRQAVEAELQRERAAAAEADRQREAAEEAERQRQAAEEAERQRQAAEESERQRQVAEEAERQRQAEALAAAAALEAAAPPIRDDRVGAPIWQIVAPETPPTHEPGPLDVPPAVLSPQAPLPTPPSATNGGAQITNGGAGAVNGAPQPPPAGASEWPSPATTPPPQWPMPRAVTAPQWPVGQGTSRGANDDLWAASSQDVLSKAGQGVQACTSCGLPLSASARFCRRCGTQQH